MYQRNKEMAKLGLTDIYDYKPTQYTGKIDICGMQFNKNDKIKVEIDGQEQELIAKEILQKVEEEKQLLESKKEKR